MGRITIYPVHSRGSVAKGTKAELATSSLPSQGPTHELKCYITTAFSGSPSKGDKIRIGYLTHAFSVAHRRAQLLHNHGILGDPQAEGTKSELATSPMPCRWPTNRPNYYVTPAFSGVPSKGDKIRIGYLILAFFGAHKWAELLRNACILGGPKQREQNQNWRPHYCLLGGANK